MNTTFLYDGPLPTKVTWTGDVVGSVAWTYNSYFLPKTETVSPAPSVGAATYTFGYDQDRLLTCVSSATTTPCNPSVTADLVLTRNTDRGAITSITIGTPTPLVETLAYSDTAADVAALPGAAFGELRSQKLTAGATNLAELVYDTTMDPRDDLGRIRSKTETFSGITTDRDYQYDERGRLIFAQTGPISSETFAYDLNGNRTSLTPMTGPVLVGKYDDQDRLTTYGTAAGTAVGDLTFSYGPNGEVKTKVVKTAGSPVTWTYAYDPLGNLVTVVKPGASATTYTYLVDGQGRRVGKKEKVGAAAETIKKRWLYRDSLNPTAELSASGTSVTIARYIYGSRPNVPDLVIKGSKTYRLFTDQLGSPRMAVNVADATDIPYRVDYSAFGVATWKGTGAAATPAFDWLPFGFAGGIYDADTGLVRFGARDYDPVVGRWVSKDPIRFGGGQANIYVYVGNDPVGRRDPLGLYGTNDCSYYAQRCAENGGSYYCEDAPLYCDNLPKPPDPDPSDEFDEEGWFRCVRQCLQDLDRSANPPGTCEAPNNSGPWNPLNPAFKDHVDCYTECFFDGTYEWFD